MRAVFLAAATALFACAAPAPIEPMAPFEPLLGCWRGTFEGQAEIHDERCFERLDQHIVDVHYVQPSTYSGESTYHYDDAQREIVYAYAASDGGRSNGVVRPRRDRIVFPPHVYRGADGSELRLRAEWRMEGADRFVTVTERWSDGAWVKMMRIDYIRVPHTEAARE